MLILLCGNYKSGKTVSAATFPKPLLYEDWDCGFSSVQNVRDKTGKLLILDQQDITVIPFYRQQVYDLMFQTDIGSKSAPLHTMEAPVLLKQHNDIIKSLAKDGCYIPELSILTEEQQERVKGLVSGIKYKTLVIDSLTTMFRVWKEMILRMNNISTLRIPDYGTLETILLGQFIPGLKSLLATGKLEHIILIDHIDMDKDEVSGMLMEFPVGPSRNMGKIIGLQFDEIWVQKKEGFDYVWRTKPTGLFQAGSRLDLPELIKPATYQTLEVILKQRG